MGRRTLAELRAFQAERIAKYQGMEEEARGLNTWYGNLLARFFRWYRYQMFERVKL